MELDLEEHEPTVLEYARFHGLCKEYSLEQPRINDVRVPSSDDLKTALQDPTNCLLTNPANELTKERLTVSKDAAFLLKLIHSMQQPDDAQSITDTRRRVSSLKQEVPILRSDNELDLQDFGSTALPGFKNLKIPFESINVENDEGLEWPSKYYAYPAQCDEQAKAEKLAISKDVLLFLQDAVRDSYTLDDSEKIKTDSLNHMRSPALQPVTPPLLPLSPPLQPYIPSSPDNHLELLSESTNSTVAEAKAFEERIMREDALLRQGSGGSDQMLFEVTEPVQTSSPLFDNGSSPILKRKIQDLRVEGPLTPPISFESPMKKLKSVSFPDMLHEYIPELPSNFETGDDVLGSQDSFADFFKDIAPLAEEVKKKVENEKISEIDTTMRVDVPDVDFSLPVTPWNEFGHRTTGKRPASETELDAQVKFLLRVKRNYLKSATSWHRMAKLERDLPWNPFLHPVSVTIDEKLHGDEVLSRMLSELTMGDIATSSAEVWKRDGLRILEDDEDREEELEPAELQEHNDMDTLIHRRKLEMEEEDANASLKGNDVREVFHVSPEPQREAHREVIQSHHWKAPVSTTRPKPPKLQLPPAPKERDSSLMFGGMFSASTALHKFMEIHGKLVKNADVERHQESKSSRPVIPPLTALPVRPSETPQTIPIGPSRGVTHPSRQEKSKVLPLPLPKLPSVPRDLPPCSFIISSTLLQQRNLAREIEKLYPGAELTERDFTLTHTSAQEADLLLSPSTGLIFTTLQQAKQRALPGQPDQSPIKDRVSHLQLRYERLILLISEGLSREMEEYGSSRPIDARDKEALMEFETFVSKMEGEVIIEYIRGGELALARSIVGQMAKWGLPHGSKDIGDIKLLQETTCWELFLRRAGLNPFAAQAILSSLKNPYDFLPTPSSSILSEAPAQTFPVSGLPAFILMSAEERVNCFQVLVGGSRILKRVSAVLDQKWPSAVHGFEM